MGDKVKKLKGKFVSVVQTFLDKTGTVLHGLPNAVKPRLRNLLHAQFKKTIIEAAVKLIFCVDCCLFGCF